MDYQKLYTMLFNAYSDAIAQMDRQNYELAREILVKAQQQTEEAYMADEEPA